MLQSEPFTVDAKLTEMAMLGSNNLTTAKRYLQGGSA